MKKKYEIIPRDERSHQPEVLKAGSVDPLALVECGLASIRALDRIMNHAKDVKLALIQAEKDLQMRALELDRGLRDEELRVQAVMAVVDGNKSLIADVRANMPEDPHLRLEALRIITSLQQQSTQLVQQYLGE